LPIRSPRDTVSFSSGQNLASRPARGSFSHSTVRDAMMIGLEANLQMATRYARNKMLGSRMGIETTFGVGNSGGLCAAGTRSLLTGYIPCQGRGHAHAAPYLPGCETIISEVGVMHDDRPRPPHPNTPCPSPECCRASTSSQLGTGELLPQQPFSSFLSLC
jgi:hypothetical protein